MPLTLFALRNFFRRGSKSLNVTEAVSGQKSMPFFYPGLDTLRSDKRPK